MRNCWRSIIHQRSPILWRNLWVIIAPKATSVVHKAEMLHGHTQCLEVVRAWMERNRYSSTLPRWSSCGVWTLESRQLEPGWGKDCPTNIWCTSSIPSGIHNNNGQIRPSWLFNLPNHHPAPLKSYEYKCNLDKQVKRKKKFKRILAIKFMSG